MWSKHHPFRSVSASAAVDNFRRSQRDPKWPKRTWTQKDPIWTQQGQINKGSLVKQLSQPQDFQAGYFYILFFWIFLWRIPQLIRWTLSDKFYSNQTGGTQTSAVTQVTACWLKTIMLSPTKIICSLIFYYLFIYRLNFQQRSVCTQIYRYTVISTLSTYIHLAG